ncbi:MAG TPA: bifunctional UDP-N-acetylglucosamine diphosphorylase/glucosamine-1-phosphate N-acetyltransferase GlmU [bacterium]|nr:bifunctional UDP-N-acetylglucosamine diphosphorylase/glucosamine-1-phosphate N-acetyltransferase GlmU [bacterium]
MKTTAVILAAGKGTRMKSDETKVLHKVCGVPMLGRVIDACVKANIRDIVVVAGANIKELKAYIGPLSGRLKIRTALQKPQLGTAHAVSAALKTGGITGRAALILSGDVPLVEPAAIRRMINRFTKERCGGIIGTSRVENSYGYGRIVRDSSGNIRRIVEEKDALPKEKRISEINGGIYLFDSGLLKRFIKKIKRNPLKKEFYLTDIVSIMADNGLIIKAETVAAEELAGINDRVQLMQASKNRNKKVLEKLAKNGITIVDFDTVFIDENVRIGRDTVIEPFTVIKGPSRIGGKCVIGPHAHIRPGTIIGHNCKIGNYTEIKNSKIGDGSSVAHLSYIGDAVLGRGVNIGAGTITANYDGKKKNRTVIGDRAYVGSNVVFVAPVKAGRGTVIGAGSVITDNVPDGTLAIARARQVVKKRKKKKAGRKR